MSRMAILLLVVAVLADSCCLAQKFHYSKGWTNGRKRMSIPALPAADQQQPQQQQRSFANSQPKMANEKSPVANNWWFDLKSQVTRKLAKFRKNLFKKFEFQ